MRLLLIASVLLSGLLPTTADAGSIRVRPGLWEVTSSPDDFQLPARLAPTRPGVAIVPTDEWRPLAACLLANQDDPEPASTAEASVRCARVQALALEQSRSEGHQLSDDGALWVQWHRNGELSGRVLAIAD